MAFWAIDATAIDRDIITNRLGKFFKVEEGDNVLIFSRIGEELHFSDYATVSKISTELGEYDEKVIVSVGLNGLAKLEPARQLSDYIYSLTKITAFDKPVFRRWMNKFEEADFKTIVNGEIFWSRSAFGYFANALPESAFLAFVTNIAQTNLKLLLGSPDYRELWKLLSHWLDDEYVEAHFFAKGIKDLATRLNTTGLDFRQLRIGKDDTSMSASLQRLQGNLEEFFVATAEAEGVDFSTNFRNDGTNLWAQIEGRIQQDEDTETQFHKLFKKKPWPLIHKIKL